MELDVENLPSGFKLGHYEIKSHVAEGGMGVVYKTFEPRLDRFVAVKVLRPFYANTPTAVSNFLDEARAIAAISHPNIVPIYFVGDERGCFFFTMPFIEGGTLDDWIDRDQYFTEAEAFWFLENAIAALTAAFKANIIHLDIKPSNFLLNKEKQLILTDFGLAQSLGVDANSAQNKEGMGTPLYVSPEQISRLATDQRTDIYSLGATLFHLLVRVPPFPGDEAEQVIYGHARGVFPAHVMRAAGLSEGWVALLQKMMAKRKEDRFANYEELSAAVQVLQAASMPIIEVAPPKRSNMAISEVYIAYADPDRETATNYCDQLEKQSLKCWLAHRDIVEGTSWATSFVLALTNAKVVVVLLSYNTNASSKVQRELDEAVHFGKPIVPVRLVDVTLCPEQAFLNKMRPMDAFKQTPEILFTRIGKAVRRFIEEMESRKEPQQERPAPTASRPYLMYFIRASILTIGLLYFISLFFFQKAPEPASSARNSAPLNTPAQTQSPTPVESQNPTPTPLPSPTKHHRPVPTAAPTPSFD